ncbi:MAG: Spy/CpxP family protein refolding chaperone [Bacteroidales bacterium]
MEIQKQKQLLIWIVIVLAILNLGMIGLFVYKNYTQTRTTETTEDHPGRYESKRPSHSKSCPKIDERFNFNEKQRQQLEYIRDKHRSKMRTFRDSINELRALQMKLIAKGEDHKPTVYKYARQIGTLYGEIHKETMDHFLEIKKIASPEQQENINEFYLDIANRKTQKNHYRSSKRPHKKGAPRSNKNDNVTTP